MRKTKAHRHEMIIYVLAVSKGWNVFLGGDTTHPVADVFHMYVLPLKWNRNGNPDNLVPASI